MLKSFFIAGLGSFFGGGFRFLLSHFIQIQNTHSFPLATLVVNILGCLFIGLLYGFFDRGLLLNSSWKLFLTVGFCGGFTTFSTFMNESLQLIKAANIWYFSLYIAASLFLGLLAVFLGYQLIKFIGL